MRLTCFEANKIDKSLPPDTDNIDEALLRDSNMMAMLSYFIFNVSFFELASSTWTECTDPKIIYPYIHL